MPRKPQFVPNDSQPGPKGDGVTDDTAAVRAGAVPAPSPSTVIEGTDGLLIGEGGGQALPQVDDAQERTAPALLGDGAQRYEETTPEKTYGTVKVRSTGPSLVVHGQTITVASDPITVVNDAETRELVATGLLTVE